MPMDFPDMKSLEFAAEVHNFRTKTEDESVEDFREALADHVQSIDLIESMEIRTGHGWDKFNDNENAELLARSTNKSDKYDYKHFKHKFIDF